jgi:class 3 adenylate cyclase
MPPVRRLTAILAADVAGYSRLRGADEEGTHERLQAHLRELIDPKIAEHCGRILPPSRVLSAEPAAAGVMIDPASPGDFVPDTASTPV